MEEKDPRETIEEKNEKGKLIKRMHIRSENEAPEQMPEKESLLPEGLKLSVLVRVAIGLVIYIIANALSLDNVIYVLLMLSAALILGYDIVMESVDEAARKNFFAYELLVLLAVVMSFAARCYKESVLLLIVYQLCGLFIDFLVFRTRDLSKRYIPEDREEDAELLDRITSHSRAKYSSIERKIAPTLDLVTKAVAILGLLYAVLAPIIGKSIDYLGSIRTGLMIILVSSPLSILVSLPLSAVTGLSHAASCGVFVREAEVFEHFAKPDEIILDKARVLTDGSPKLLSYRPRNLDAKTFIALAAHVADNSGQGFAMPIVKEYINVYNGQIMPGVVEDFRDIPGRGMEAVVGGQKISLYIKDILDTRRISIPNSDLVDGLVLYMTVSDEYAGYLRLEDNISDEAKDAVDMLNAVTGAEIVLFTEDDKILTDEIANDLGIRSSISECDAYSKRQEIKRTAFSVLPKGAVLMFVSADELNYHTAAAIDVRVGKRIGKADALISGYDEESLPLSGLPYACAAAKRMLTIQRENVIFAMLMKFALIAFALTGKLTLWFVVLADLVAAILTIINTTRISDVSLVHKLMRRE